MSISEQIKTYITGQPEPKRSEMQNLHQLIIQVSPGCKVWFLDGKTAKAKPFQILTLATDHTPSNMQTAQPLSFTRLA